MNGCPEGYDATDGWCPQEDEKDFLTVLRSHGVELDYDCSCGFVLQEWLFVL